jgi:hypothetical protein
VSLHDSLIVFRCRNIKLMQQHIRSDFIVCKNWFTQRKVCEFQQWWNFQNEIVSESGNGYFVCWAIGRCKRHASKGTILSHVHIGNWPVYYFLYIYVSLVYWIPYCVCILPVTRITVQASAHPDIWTPYFSCHMVVLVCCHIHMSDEFQDWCNAIWAVDDLCYKTGCIKPFNWSQLFLLI